mmetsp:Transcript_12383/g.19278  ORF Transcript_12383/g.19278 Transcript_12383/m.19278 type:complete len:135 (+) Transcript_12383:819-1223(+)
MSAFQFIARVFLMGFLVTMFILRYMKFNKSLEASKLKEVIALKNMISYDREFGAITMTFFPINIILLPFILPLVLMRSERLSTLVLQIQYGILGLFYFVVGLLLAGVLVPLFYLKILLNSAYVAIKNKHQSYKL